MTARQVLLRIGFLVAGALLVVTLAARGVRLVPDLVALVVAVIALRGGSRAGVGAGLVGGWALDLLPPGSMILGWSALTYAAAGLVVGRFRRHGSTPFLVIAGHAVLATVIVDAGSAVLALLRGGPVDLLSLAVRWLLTGTVALLVGPILARWDGYAARPRW